MVHTGLWLQCKIATWLGIDRPGTHMKRLLCPTNRHDSLQNRKRLKSQRSFNENPRTEQILQTRQLP